MLTRFALQTALTLALATLAPSPTPTVARTGLASWAPVPAAATMLAYDGTDGGCTKIPGQDKHPAPTTPRPDYLNV